MFDTASCSESWAACRWNLHMLFAAVDLRAWLRVIIVNTWLCHAPSNCFLFFVSRWHRAIFWSSVLHVALYRTLFFDFWFRPLTPKICTESPISRLVRQIDRRCLGLPGGFGDGRFNGTMQNVAGPTLVAMAMKFGLGAGIQSPTGLFMQPPSGRRQMRICFAVFFFVFCFWFFSVHQNYETTVLRNGWTDFYETFTKR